MKFSKIASIMKKTKTAILFTDADGMQWLSNGAAVYKLENMPPLDEDTVLTVMGVADDAKSKWHTATREDEKELLLDHVDDEEEITAEDAGICIVHNGKKLVPIYTCDGMLWLDVELLDPTEKKEMGYRKFFVRKMGRYRAIAVKEGLVLTAVILEVNVWKDTGLSDCLKNLLHCCRAEEVKRMADKDWEKIVSNEMEGEDDYDSEEWKI